MNAWHRIATVAAVASIGVACDPPPPAATPVVATASATARPTSGPPGCPKEIVVELDGVAVWKLPKSTALGFKTGLHFEADDKPKGLVEKKPKGPKVDVASLPYVKLPAEANDWGVAPGDFAVVMSSKTKRIAFAIVGEVSANSKLGDASKVLASSLGIADEKDTGVVYSVFPKSGSGGARPAADIEAEGQKLFDALGGRGALAICFH